MARLHPHGNQYLPNKVIVGWFGEAPENDHPILLNDHHDEDLSDGANSKPVVENLPYAAPFPIPNPRPTFHGPAPPWVECLETCSQGQDQPMPFNGVRSFYDLSNGGSADRILPILVRRVARNEIQGRTTLHQIAKVVANARMHTLRTIHLEDAHKRSERNHENLLQALAENPSQSHRAPSTPESVREIPV